MSKNRISASVVQIDMNRMRNLYALIFRLPRWMWTVSVNDRLIASGVSRTRKIAEEERRDAEGTCAFLDRDLGPVSFMPAMGFDMSAFREATKK